MLSILFRMINTPTSIAKGFTQANFIDQNNSTRKRILTGKQDCFYLVRMRSTCESTNVEAIDSTESPLPLQVSNQAMYWVWQGVSMCFNAALLLVN